jgi:O-antigen ligase
MTNYKKRNKIIITLFFSISFLLSAILIPGIKVRFLETFQSFNSVPKGVAYDSTNIRVAIYKCDLELLKDNFWLGIGSNNLKTDIRNCFASNYDAEFYKENYYITHNYFIYILLSTGIIGFLFFAYYLYYFSKKILATKWLEPIVLLISTIIICFSEDYFYRNFGMFNFSILSLTFLKNKSFI